MGTPVPEAGDGFARAVENDVVTDAAMLVLSHVVMQTAALCVATGVRSSIAGAWIKHMIAYVGYGSEYCVENPELAELIAAVRSGHEFVVPGTGGYCPIIVTINMEKIRAELKQRRECTLEFDRFSLALVAAQLEVLTRT